MSTRLQANLCVFTPGEAPTFGAHADWDTDLDFDVPNLRQLASEVATAGQVVVASVYELDAQGRVLRGWCWFAWNRRAEWGFSSFPPREPATLCG